MGVIMKNGALAVTQPIFKKIEAEVQGGIARALQRVELLEVELVLGYITSDGVSLKKGDSVIVRQDAGLQPWAKQLMRLGEDSFVLCPESAILGYRVK